ncbi:MAG: FmdB family zinc ribbon protein [Atribacterota bacterium]
MPTYEYQCKKCGYTFEKFQSITAKPLQHCPKCNGEAFRLISKNGSFILKGSGYYSTDNRRKHIPKENKNVTDKTPKKSSDKPVTEETKNSTTAKAKNESAKT